MRGTAAALGRFMLTACILLVLLGAFGAFDVAFFHMKRAKISERPECRTEAVLHIVRGVVYAIQFALLPNVALRGAWVAALFVLFAIDASVAALDVLVEPKSRAAQGGLPPGEYFMHILLSVLAGALIHSALGAAWSTRHDVTTVFFAAQAPLALRIVLGVMAVGSLGSALLDLLTLVDARLRRPRPIHVSVEVPATLQELWDVTQDHHRHPAWDHRFDRIHMHAERIETGTEMTYEKTVLGVTIRGWGRYQLHLPRKQSTFAFGSPDLRSLIEEGIGLWRYREVRPGFVELSTSYTYRVRWGVIGRIFDRVLFRPLFQWETENSFRRLAHDFFGVRRPHVLGAIGRKPARLVLASA